MTNPSPTTILNTATSDGAFAAIAAHAADAVVAAAEPIDVGDHSLLVRHPADWVAEVIDVRPNEDYPRERGGTFGFATVESLVRYVNRYADDTTLGYMVDATGRGATILTQDLHAATYILDDYSNDPSETIWNRKHRATLTLRPTTAARRWGKALSAPLSQVQMVELVIDGVGEIAAPEAADLRDLISDLHAIRTASARGVVRTGGGLAVEVSENIALHAGPGNLVTVPETLTLVLRPWTAVEATITTVVKIRPVIAGEVVTFRLDAPHVEEALNTVLSAIHGHLGDQDNGTGVEPYWATSL